MVGLDKDRDLPPRWAWAKLGELVGLGPNSITDGPFGSNLKTQHYTDAGPRVIRLQNIGDGVFKDAIAHISENHYKNLRKHAVYPGDIVIAAFGDPAPRACLVPDIGPAIVKADCIRLKPTEHVFAEYLMYALNSPGVQKRTTAKVHGVGRPRINLKEIKEIEVPVAPNSEQKRIAEQIDALCTDLDAAVAALKRVQANLKRYRSSVLKAACEGRLVPTEAELARKEGRAYETGEQLLARILKERRAKWEADQLAKMLAAGKPPSDDDWKEKYKQPEPPETTGLPDIPSGWAWGCMDQLLHKIGAGRSFRCEERPPAAGRFGVVKVSSVSWGEFDEQESKTCLSDAEWTPDYRIEVGDFLFSRANTIELVGACVVAKHVTLRLMLSDKILRFDLSDQVPKEWVLSVLRSRWGRFEIERLATGNQESMRNIGQDRIKRIRIPIPPAEECLRILSAMDDSMNAASVVDDSVETERRRADRLRQSILKRAFEGKLVPQDPNDEPASVLLERIRAERAARDNVSRQPSKKRESRRAVAAQKGQP